MISPGMDRSIDITVIILTYNEELNIEQALNSVTGWAKEVIILDSGSTDATVEIAGNHGARVCEHPFEDYARQRNHALGIEVQTEWSMFLDADEWLPEETRNEISELISRQPEENGFYLKWKFIWMGKWIRRGYYPTWVLRLFRTGKATCGQRGINEHLLVPGKTGKLENHFIHEDQKGLHAWITKHNEYARREARELLVEQSGGDIVDIQPRLFGSQAQRKRWLRFRLWQRLPPLIRPFFYFVYRYLLRGGFLDGSRALIFHFLHAFWYRFLIDCYYIELRVKRRANYDQGATQS